jgi:hypothetical protein
MREIVTEFRSSPETWIQTVIRALYEWPIEGENRPYGARARSGP